MTVYVWFFLGTIDNHRPLPLRLGNLMQSFHFNNVLCGFRVNYEALPAFTGQLGPPCDGSTNIDQTRRFQDIAGLRPVSCSIMIRRNRVNIQKHSYPPVFDIETPNIVTGALVEDGIIYIYIHGGDDHQSITRDLHTHYICLDAHEMGRLTVPRLSHTWFSTCPIVVPFSKSQYLSLCSHDISMMFFHLWIIYSKSTPIFQ